MNYSNGQDIIVNNVKIPRNVASELRRLGKSLEWYNRGELQSAVRACMFDSRLIDDHNGTNFMDKLILTNAEKREEEAEEIHEINCISNKLASFCKRLKKSRAKNHFNPNNGICFP